MVAFSHYARLKQILNTEPPGWYIVRINTPTTVANFKNEKVVFDHYYRLYHLDGTPIKYGKFQQLARLAQVLGIEEHDLPILDEA